MLILIMPLPFIFVNDDREIKPAAELLWFLLERCALAIPELFGNSASLSIPVRHSASYFSD